MRLNEREDGVLRICVDGGVRAGLSPAGAVHEDAPVDGLHPRDRLLHRLQQGRLHRPQRVPGSLQTRRQQHVPLLLTLTRLSLELHLPTPPLCTIL